MSPCCREQIQRVLSALIYLAEGEGDADAVKTLLAAKDGLRESWYKNSPETGPDSHSLPPSLREEPE